MSLKIDMTLCRVCRKQGTGTNIYTGDIFEKYIYVTLVQAEKNDGLSEIICKDCLKRLQIAFLFKKEAVKSNNELLSFLSKVNKDYQQLTAGGAVKTESVQIDGGESYDELDEDIDALIDEHQLEPTNGDNDDNNEKQPDEESQRLVEILGATDDGLYEIQEPQSTARRFSVVNQDTVNDEHTDGVEVFFIDENDVEIGSNADSDYLPNDEYSDENAGEIITDNLNEPQYLEYDENDDQLYDEKSQKKTPHKQPKSASIHNPNNQCNVCGKTFSTRTNLTRHKITHNGAKPYQCTICGNSFTQNGSLKSHMFIHTGERPYVCQVAECGKAFTQSKSLKFHMRRHTGEKPFPCEFCGVEFRQKDGLKRHIAAKHMINRSKKHVCEVCGKTLLSKYSLNMHVSKHSAKEIAAAKKNRLKSERLAAKNSATVVHKTVMEEEPYEMFDCEFCSLVFNSLTDLVEHREAHAEVQDNTKYMDDSG